MDDTKIEYTTEMQERLRFLCDKSKKSHKDIAIDLNISDDQFSFLFRSDGNGPLRKRIDQTLIDSFSDYFQCTRDYILCKSDDPLKNANGSTRALSFDRSQDLGKVFDMIRNLSTSEKERLIEFALYTPPDVQRKFIDLVKSLVRFTKNESISSYINNSSSFDSFRVYVKAGLHDDIYVRSLILTQKAEGHISKKKYRDALRVYCEAILQLYKADDKKNAPLNQLYSIICSHVTALKDLWSQFPKDDDITGVTAKDLSVLSEEDITVLNNMIKLLTKREVDDGNLPPDTNKARNPIK